MISNLLFYSLHVQRHDSLVDTIPVHIMLYYLFYIISYYSFTILTASRPSREVVVIINSTTGTAIQQFSWPIVIYFLETTTSSLDRGKWIASQIASPIDIYERQRTTNQRVLVMYYIAGLAKPRPFLIYLYFQGSWLCDFIYTRMYNSFSLIYIALKHVHLTSFITLELLVVDSRVLYIHFWFYLEASYVQDPYTYSGRSVDAPVGFRYQIRA